MSALEDAVTFLRQHLAGGEPVEGKDIQSAAKAAGIAAINLRRARERIGVEVLKQDMSGPWFWYLLDGVSTEGRSRTWLVRELMEAKKAGDVNRHEDATSAAQFTAGRDAESLAWPDW